MSHQCSGSSISLQSGASRTTLRIFPVQFLSGSSWAALHKVFTCPMSQEYSENIEKIFLGAMLPEASRTALHRVFPVQCFNNVPVQ